MRKTVYIMAAAIIACSSPAGGEGLDSLMEVGRSMADINAAMDKETKAFNAVKAAVDSGDIKKGLSQDEIRSRYGEPVIANDDSSTNREKWTYKPADSSFFKGVRIYLFFDDKGILDEIRTSP
ncbi:MAG: hypothetical protein KJ994_05965 [Candidatus Omnitrophica bacterium]|nr:hypothetical protein [Candidatus Omnitrophota bacterium]